MSSTQTAHTQPVGLVGWWKFDEGTGTAALDSSGNGNHGTIYNGAAYVPGVSGTALEFDGTDDYVEVPHSSSLNAGNQITVEFWMKTTQVGPPEGNVPITKTDGTAATGRQAQVRYDTGVGLVGFGVGNGNSWELSGPHSQTAVNDGIWHQVVGTYDRVLGQLNIYVDGRLEGTVSGSTFQNRMLDNSETPLVWSTQVG